MADTPTDPAPAAAPSPDAAPADAAASITDLQSGVDALAASAAALDEAAKTASDIVQQVKSVASAESPVPGEKSPQAATTNAESSPIADNPSVPSPAELPAMPPELRRLLAIEVPIIVRLGLRKMSVGEVMRFAVGAIIELQKASDEDLDLLANNLPIGKGQAVKVGENFGIRLTHVGSVKETIRKLGGA